MAKSKYKTGQCFQAKYTSAKKGLRQRDFEAVIKLGKKYPPKKGKGDRFEVIIISGEWPYNSISVYNLDRWCRPSKAAEVLYGPQDFKPSGIQFKNGIAMSMSTPYGRNSLYDMYNLYKIST